ncbi:MAG: glycosyltransferase [Actinobacteria bacterium]|nr:glycosyltransferase [Actinomycetota bacterium]
MNDIVNDVIFYLQQYTDLYPFLIPLGIIGIWRWGVWSLKKITASFYKPSRIIYSSKVSIVTPVYNENPDTFLKALRSWKKNNPSEIIAVIDYTDVHCISTFKKFSEEFKNTILIITKTPGKREALAEGIKRTNERIVALVDSDTLWDENVINNSLPPFADKKVAGVGTYQNVLKPNTVAQKIFDLQLNLRYSDDFPFLSYFGDALVCLSGRTAFYRTDVIKPLLPDLVNETFLGKKVISGDDKRLTYLVLSHGWKVKFQNNAHVYTPGMEDLRSYLKQRLRWTRNSIRADLRAISEGWVWKHKALAFYQIDKIFQGFVAILSPIYFAISIITGLWIPALAIFTWWFVSRSIKMLPHLKRRRKDITILPFFVPYTFLTAGIKIYALLTLNTQGWITRWDKSRLPRLKLLQTAPSYAAFILLIVLLTTGVYFYKQYAFFIPMENQKELASNIMVESKNLNLDSLPNTGPQKDLVIQKYTLKEGESLGSVAQKFGISVDTLRDANISRLINWNNLEPGFILNIPGKDIVLTSSNNFNYQRIHPDVLQIVYEESTNSIVISGRGETITLSDIRDRLGNNYLEEISPKVWYLKANLYISSGVTLILDKNQVEWLRMSSSDKGYVILRGYNATVLINGVKITSWDESNRTFDNNLNDGRSYILVKDGTRMDIYDSDLSYLGFPTNPDLNSSPYGVSWRMSNGKLGTTLLTGEIINSKFHHNYFGAYTYGATGMIWRGNEFYDNIRYGLDPHDDSNGFLVENNKFYRNGTHGLIFSKRCINNIIRNNISYGNKIHGIMLHEKSNNNIIEKNNI